MKAADKSAQAYLGDFRPIPCGKIYPQHELTGWLAARMLEVPGLDGGSRAAAAAALLGRLGRGGPVASRATCVSDLDYPPGDSRRLFREDGEAPWWRPTLASRMQRFSDVSRAVAEAAFPAGEEAPRHMIQVTCTGYEAPTAVQRLASRRGWTAATRCLQLGHMGCFAAVPATALAASLTGQGRVSLLHIELCTLHLRLDDVEPDQVVIHYLFADGAIRYDVTKAPPPGPSLALLDTFETMLPDSADAMTWRVSDGGFQMRLARHVPVVVGRALPGLVADFLARHGLYRGDVRHFAIHPGGSRVLDGIAGVLEIDEAGMAPSRAVLRERGNMSSATLPHVWAALAADPAVAPGELILSLAFGPGLTVTGNLFRKDA